MPLYEYACDACGYRFEELVSRTDSPNPPCPKPSEQNQEPCRGQTRKLVSASHFQLVGGGWAADGYGGGTPSRGRVN